MNLEAALAEQVGPLAGQLHTGRSRNDQVATDLRLWTRRAIDELDAALLDFERALVDLAEREGTAVLPGTTHIQPAQPVLFAHHLLAYVEMAERDRGRLADARAPGQRLAARVGRAGRRRLPARPRGDRRASSGSMASRANSLDAVSDRDFVVETLAAVALGMVHLSRLAEEITWWSNPRVRVRPRRRRVLDRQLDDAQQEEPRPGRAGPRPRRPRHRGADRRSLTLLKGLPLAYQRDLQEDMAPLFDAVAVLRGLARVMAGLVETLTVDARPDARGGRRGLHDRDGRRRRARPARRAVPDRPPHRRVAGRPGRGARRSASTRSPTR